ncbi:phytochelatin synthase family protein [Planktothrix sp. FACHB-1355]|uniref:glutathione gamma-glutamylcysteinyltransferase n=1 Tax=Aerosakkonema funiforme FACHB-1375 TaxID=2949571 RepID=A0A926VGU7_9CYAN|nr:MULTISPECIES: phytochelatin synthase family protein [Oscillatoriales]MBD2183484.1 phytochelatin synthase family protein [Aerosakkonema funiforme FACHB-1375]MBD3559049.1 phytochelatin synthase family protein [Planktothrix sp. FACHB-1355]
MSEPGFYRRPLPDSAIAFSSVEGRQIFREALALGGMEGYFALAEQFHTQVEPAFCGLGSLVVVLNALSIDPGRIWKGVWRWYGEEFLDCCLPLSVVKENGITFDEFACIARCNGAVVKANRYHQSSLEKFRQAVEQVTTASGDIHLVVSYSRKVLGQTGDGHFSPIGGYHPKRDLVLILDVARFKYPPHWISLPLLWKAFEPVDPVTNKCRGYISLQKSEKLQETFFNVDFDLHQWRSVAPYFAEILPDILTKEQPLSIVSVVSTILHHWPVEFTTMLDISSQRTEIFDKLWAAIRLNPLFEIIQQCLYSNVWDAMSEVGKWRSQQPFVAEIITVILLSCPPTLYVTLKSDLRLWFEEVRYLEKLFSPLDIEISRLREQMLALQEFYTLYSKA